jgi:two-component system sensor histidine kinase KdpD
MLMERLRMPGAVVPSSFGGYVSAALACGSLVVGALGLALVIEHFLRVPNVLLVFLPVVLVAAVRYGFWFASFASVLSIVATSYFTEPRYSFAVAEAGNVWALLIFLLVAAFTSSLAAQIRQRAAAISRHSRVIEQLYALSSKLASHSDIGTLADEGTRQIASMLNTATVLLLPDGGKLSIRAHSAGQRMLPTPELLAATWCWSHGQPSGRGTDILANAAHVYLPLDTARGTVGVLGIQRPSEAEPLSGDEARLVDALCDQLAVSLDRAKLAEEKLETEMLSETEKLRTALLTSISHDLRTPLASILGNISSLRRYGNLYDDATRSEMLEYAENETLRLSRFVENLLYMTRIDAGALRPTIEAVDLADVIGSALKRAEKRTSGHVLCLDVPADLPMAYVDFVLAEHVLVNLLDNAAKYSPTGSTITITVEVLQHSDRLQIVMLDEGPGIPPEDLPRIFERFTRARVTDHRRTGVGLGLAICKGFVEAMGGRITARNRTDRSGAVLVVDLPRARRSAA